MSEERPPVGRNPTAIYEFIKPINIVSLLVGIIGLFLAWYFYQKSEHIPEVSWTIQRQIIFDSKSATSAIVVSDHNGQRITSDLYAAQIVVWNSGDSRLDNVDKSSLIRNPLVFSIEGDGRIISASIVNSKDATASALQLTETERDVKVTWERLIPLSQVDQYLGLASRTRNGAGFEFFGRS